MESPTPEARKLPLKRFLPMILSLIPWLLIVLLGSQNLMIAPPHTLDTLALYGGLWLLGLVMLGIDSWRRNTKGRMQGCLNVIGIGAIAVVVMIVLLALVGPLVGAVFVSSLDNGSKCSTDPLPDGNLRYTCDAGSGENIILEGRPGQPFVRLVDTNSIND